MCKAISNNLTYMELKSQKREIKLDRKIFKNKDVWNFPEFAEKYKLLVKDKKQSSA